MLKFSLHCLFFYDLFREEKGSDHEDRLSAPGEGCSVPGGGRAANATNPAKTKKRGEIMKPTEKESRNVKVKHRALSKECVAGETKLKPDLFADEVNIQITVQAGIVFP